MEKTRVLPVVVLVLAVLTITPTPASAGEIALGTIAPPSTITMKPTDAEVVPLYFVNMGYEPLDVELYLDHRDTNTITVRANGAVLPYEFRVPVWNDPLWLGDKNLVLSDGSTMAKMKRVNLEIVSSNTPPGTYRLVVTARTVPEASITGTGQAVSQERRYEFTIRIVDRSGHAPPPALPDNQQQPQAIQSYLSDTIGGLANIVEQLSSAISWPSGWDIPVPGIPGTAPQGSTRENTGPGTSPPTQTGESGTDTDTLGLPTGRLLFPRQAGEQENQPSSGSGTWTALGVFALGASLGILYSRKNKRRRTRLW